MKTRKKFLLNFAVGSALLFFLVFPPTALLQSVPSLSVGRAWLARVGQKSGLFKVKSFRKTDGINRGDGVYTMDFEAVVVCTDTNDPGGTGPLSIVLTACDRPACQKGKTVKYADSVTFQKYERGWRFSHCGR